MNKKMLILIMVLLVLIIGGIIMASPLKKMRVEILIEKTLQNIQSDLKGIKSDFPQLSGIDKAEIKVEPPNYNFIYRKGFGIAEREFIKENGCNVVVSIVYPKNPKMEGGVMVEEEPPTFNGTVNKKLLEGNIIIEAEKNQQANLFRESITKIINFRLKEMEQQLNTQFNFFESDYFKIPTDEKAEQHEADIK